MCSVASDSWENVCVVRYTSFQLTLTSAFARKCLAESQRDCRARVVARDNRIFRDVLAYGVGQLRRARVLRQAEVLPDARSRSTANRVDGVEDAVSGAFDVCGARTARRDVGLRAQFVEVAPVNAAADNGTANALAKIKARSMVFLSRVVYQAVCCRIRTARERAATKSSFCTVLRCGSRPAAAISRQWAAHTGACRRAARSIFAASAANARSDLRPRPAPYRSSRNPVR